jgi:uncharacterized membrane protein YcaP (DUF421 family)
MNILSNQYVQIVISCLVIYLFIVAAFRLLGKKELSQLSIVDLVFILLISNAVQNAMVGSNTTLIGGLIAAGSLFAFNFLYKQLIFRFPRLSNLIEGEAIMIIYDGKLIEKNVAKTRITYNEISEILREHGVPSIEEVDLAVLEVDGNISVLSEKFSKKTIRKRKSKQTIDQIQ